MKTRLTLVGQLIFQPMAAQPTDFNVGFSRWLSSDEQPWLRKLKVGPEWQQLDVGWLKDVGVAYLLIRNDIGVDRQFNPTDEQRVEEARKVLQVGLSIGYANSKPVVVPFAQCRPGECGVQVDPMSLSDWYIRAPFGAQATLFAVPL